MGPRQIDCFDSKIQFIVIKNGEFNMTNEELLLEYEFTTALYITAVENEDEEAVEKYEKYLNKLKAEILKRMK